MNQMGFRGVEYKKIEKKIKQGDLSIINDELIEKVARYKLYYCLWNAHKRVKGREDYKDIQFLLGEYKKGFDYLKVHKKELHEKLITITKIYLYNNMDTKLAPQIHRELEHYSWDTIDILTAKEHKEIDTRNSKATIVSGRFTSNKQILNKETKPLTMNLIKKFAEAKQAEEIEFPSITKANKYLQKEYGIKGDIKKIIDTSETTINNKGYFEVFKVENRERVFLIKLGKSNTLINKKFPQINETINSLKALISTANGKNALKIWLEKSDLEKSGYRLKRCGYEGLNIKWC